MIDNYRYRVSAQVVSVDEQIGNEVYMTVTLKMISTAPNLNNHVVERSFMQSVIANPDFYMATPIKVDIAALLARKTLTHLYNERKGEFLGTQIGAITEFKLVEEDGESVLYGTARIEKWRSDVVERILELYNSGRLFFSFELWASETRTVDGLIYIGAAEHNFLTAMCIVSNPAYRGARAMTLVAEDETGAQKDELTTRIYELVFAENDKFGQDWEVIDLTSSRAILNKGDEYKIMNFHAEENEGTTRVVIDKMSELDMNKDTKENLETEDLEAQKKRCAEGEGGGEGEGTAPATEAAPEGEATPEAETADPAPATESVETPAEPATEPSAPAEEPAAEPELPALTPDPEPAPDAVALSERTKEDLDRLQKELDELRAYKAQIEADRIAAEKKEHIAALKVFAARVGIDANANAEAIEALDYVKLVASFIDTLPKEEPAKIAADVNPMVGGGLPLKGANKWAGFVTDPTGIGD